MLSFHLLAYFHCIWKNLSVITQPNYIKMIFFYCWPFASFCYVFVWQRKKQIFIWTFLIHFKNYLQLMISPPLPLRIRVECMKMDEGAAIAVLEWSWIYNNDNCPVDELVRTNKDHFHICADSSPYFSVILVPAAGLYVQTIFSHFCSAQLNSIRNFLCSIHINSKRIGVVRALFV